MMQWLIIKIVQPVTMTLLAHKKEFPLYSTKKGVPAVHICWFINEGISIYQNTMTLWLRRNALPKEEFSLKSIYSRMVTVASPQVEKSVFVVG